MVERLTESRIRGFVAPAGRDQAFLRDSERPGLAVRVGSSGTKTFVFERRLPGQGKVSRVKLGSVDAMTLGQARAEASRLLAEVERGRAAVPERMQSRQRAEKSAVTVGEIWADYVTKGRPRRKDAWKPRYVADMRRMVAAPEPRKRGQGMTKPGLLHSLLDLPVASLDEPALLGWFEAAAERSPHQATRALMMLKGMLRWAKARPEWRPLIPDGAGQSEAVAQELPVLKRRTDAIEDTDLPAFWSATQSLNQHASLLLQFLILTGCRREEAAGLCWDSVDLARRTITTADKINASRTVPIGPWLARRLESIDRHNGFVFYSSHSKLGRITEPRSPLETVGKLAGIPRVSVHGLRRTCLQLHDLAGSPTGVARQLAGHSVLGVHDGYKLRTVEGLRPFQDKFETFVLDLVGARP